MSNEKRQTRLLPFRLRRTPRADAGARGEEDFSADAELTALLRTWEAPGQDSGARARLLADFRANVRRPPLWRRALDAQVRVPLPVAACLGVLLLGSLYALGTRAANPRVEAPPTAQTEASAQAVRVVEVPVVRERVVTRTVYVEKKGRDERQAAPLRPGRREELARRDDKNERGAEAPQGQEPAQGQETHAGYFTRVDMNDFQPTNEVKLRIVSRGGTDEK
jgi:hypothetical protein